MKHKKNEATQCKSLDGRHNLVMICCAKILKSWVLSENNSVSTRVGTTREYRQITTT